MNIVKKIYCRGFQKAFHIALPVLPYKNPKILTRVEDIIGVINSKGLKKPFIVTDKNLRELGITKSLEECLDKNNLTAVIYDKTVPNPTTDLVEEALKEYTKGGCDLIIAFGGGSPMDCAKAVGARVARPNKSLSDMSGILKVWKKTPLIIAIPTTAGTGSETTLAAVITDSKTRHKYCINDFPLIPSYAVLDVQTIRNLPVSVAATTGMDALTHAVEAYIGKSTTKYTRKEAISAVTLIFENIEKAVLEKDEDAQKAMLWASHSAGRAFTRSYVGYVHALSHALSGKYDMPHGLTNAILLPVVLEEYGEKAYKKLAELARCVNLGEKSDSDEVLAKLFIEEIKSFNRKFGISEKISGIDKKDVTALVKYADKEANPLYPVPVLWDASELEKIYLKVMEK